jgi:anti-sigma regulatory factor (Ser/Thr protein kinase)
MPPVLLLDNRIPPDAAALGPARDRLVAVLRRLACRDVVTETDAEIAELLASELLTNAIRHAGLGPGQTIRLRATLPRRGRLRLEVSHDGADLPFPATVTMPPTRACGGRGLAIVDALAAEWGVERGGVLTVWAEIVVGVPGCAPAAAAPAAAGAAA